VQAEQSDSARKRSGKTQRGLGRPAGGDGEQVKQALLDAARQLFLSYQFKAVSIRQIAEQAGVNGAMVNYYFGGKKGLYLAMVDQVFSALEEPLQELHRHSGRSVTDFITAYMKFLAANPWWPNFIIREVLFGDEEFRQSIIEKFSVSFALGLTSAIGSEIESGRYRNDLQPELAVWSLMGMMVFPFLSRPIAQQLLQQNFNAEAVQALTSHTSRLFEEGVLNREALP
jgi:AcrR family transcriptional regulator